MTLVESNETAIFSKNFGDIAALYTLTDETKVTFSESSSGWSFYIQIGDNSKTNVYFE